MNKLERYFIAFSTIGVVCLLEAVYLGVSYEPCCGYSNDSILVAIVLAFPIWISFIYPWKNKDSIVLFLSRFINSIYLLLYGGAVIALFFYYPKFTSSIYDGLESTNELITTSIFLVTAPIAIVTFLMEMFFIFSRLYVFVKKVN
jgi:hypothetical protein